MDAILNTMTLPELSGGIVPESPTSDMPASTPSQMGPGIEATTAIPHLVGPRSRWWACSEAPEQPPCSREEHDVSLFPTFWFLGLRESRGCRLKRTPSPLLGGAGWNPRFPPGCFHPDEDDVKPHGPGDGTN